MLLLPKEVQEIIFKCLFKSYELVVKRKENYKFPARGGWVFVNAKRYRLAWSPSPGPLPILLTNSEICRSALEALDRYTTRTISVALTVLYDRSPTISFLGRTAFHQRPQLALRIHYFSISSLDEIWQFNNATREEKDLLSQNLRVVIVNQTIRRFDEAPWIPWSWNDIEPIFAALSAEVSQTENHNPFQSQQASLSAATKFARRAFDSTIWDDHHPLQSIRRWYAVHINVMAFSPERRKTLMFQVVVPRGIEDCRGHCPPRILKGQDLQAWKDRRRGQQIRTDCACLIVGPALPPIIGESQIVSGLVPSNSSDLMSTTASPIMTGTPEPFSQCS